MAKRVIPKTITEEQFFLLLKDKKVKDNPNYKIGLMLGFYQAMRVSEITSLQKEHVDKNRKLIMIKEGKGKKDRNIPISPLVMGGLRHIPVGVGIRQFQKFFNELTERVLGEKLNVHLLRHSGATYYLNTKKWDIRQVQVFLGHSRIGITEIYTHVNNQDLMNKMWEE